MTQNHVDGITLQSARRLYRGSHLENDLLLVDDFSKMRLPDTPRRMQCLLMALCLEGEAQYTIDTVSHTVRPNDLFIVSEGQVTDNYQLTPDFKGIAIMVSYAFFSEIIAGIRELSSLFLFSRSHPVCSLQADEADSIVTYYHVLKRKVDDVAHQFRRETVRSLLETMIYDVSNVIYRMQNSSGRYRSRADEIFAHFIKKVEQNFRVERRVGWYSAQMCITPKYLSEMVKLVSHRTPNEWIDQYVSMEMRVLLKTSNKSIKEITQELHFPNQSFFGKYFKEHVGMSPSDYRKL